MGKFFKDLPANPGVTDSTLVAVSYPGDNRTYKATRGELSPAGITPFKDLPANPGITDATLVPVSYETDTTTYKATKGQISPPSGGTNAGFRATMSSDQVALATTSNQIEFDTEDYDLNSDYDPGSFFFIASVAGIYHVEVSLIIDQSVVAGTKLDASVTVYSDYPSFVNKEFSTRYIQTAAYSGVWPFILRASGIVNIISPLTYDYYIWANIGCSAISTIKASDSGGAGYTQYSSFSVNKIIET